MPSRPELMLVFHLKELKTSPESVGMSYDEVDDLYNTVVSKDLLQGYVFESWSDEFMVKGFVEDNEGEMLTDSLVFDYDLTGVVGYKIEAIGHGAYSLYALSDLYKQFAESRLFPLKKVSRRRRSDPDPEKYPDDWAFEHGLAYEGFTLLVRGWWFIAKFLFKKALNLDVTPEMCEVSLYMRWG